MTLQNLVKFLDSYEPIKTRGSGLKLADLRNLSKMNIVKLHKFKTKKGTLPKTPNGFELTSFGRQVVRLSQQQQEPVDEVLRKTLHELKNTREELFLVKERFNKVENTVTNIERTLNELDQGKGISGTPKQPRGVTESQLLQFIKQTSRTVPQNHRMGALISIHFIVSEMIEAYGASRDHALNMLLGLSQKRKIEVQMGPEPVEQAISLKTASGSRFHWFAVQ